MKELLLVGGSPHGARPKALVHFNPETNAISTVPATDHEPYLFKFPAQTEHREVCAVEHVYCETARACKVDVPATHYVPLGRTHSAFGIARFDTEGGMRVPVQTLAGALHADFRVPAVDYTTFLRATRALTLHESEVVKAYERAAFNVLFNNRDDHSKNFAFRLGRDRQWRLAPGYDLTFCEGPGGEHQMAVCGEARQVTRAHLAELAQRVGIKERTASASLERILDAVSDFERRLRAAEIRAATVRSVMTRVRRNQTSLA